MGRPRPLAPLLPPSLALREGPRPASPQSLTGLCHPWPSCPGIQGRERDGAHGGRGSPKGPHSCQVSTEKSDAVCESWKQAGEREWDADEAAEPQAWGLPRSHPAGPTMLGQGGCQEARGRTSKCPRPTPALTCSGTAAPTGPRGSNCPAPSRGVNTEPFETSKAQAEVSEGKGGGGSKSRTLGRRAPPSPPPQWSPLTCSPHRCHHPHCHLLPQ